MFEQVHANEITRQWLAKNPTEFWKVWHKTFGKRIDVALPGCHSDQETAEQFASHFRAVYYPSISIDESAAVDEFLYKHKHYVAINNKTADADKLCTEVSIELKIWDTF